MKNYGLFIARIFFMDKKSCDLCVITLIVLATFTALTCAMAKEQQIWLNPCGVHHVEDVPLRHRKAQGGIKLVTQTLKITLQNFRFVNRTEISKIYKSVQNITQQIEDHNLPSRQYQEFVSFRSKHPKMNKEKMIRHWIPKLYTRLQTYGVAFTKLSNMIPQTQSHKPIEQERNHTIRGLLSNLKGLVCEVQTSINTTAARLPLNIEQTAFKSAKNWPQKPDLTSIMTRDMSIFLEYKLFLEDWHKITRAIDGIGRESRTTDPMKKKQLEKRRKRGNRKNQRAPPRRMVSNS